MYVSTWEQMRLSILSREMSLGHLEGRGLAALLLDISVTLFHPLKCHQIQIQIGIQAQIQKVPKLTYKSQNIENLFQSIT